jgi:hypothetical protein
MQVYFFQNFREENFCSKQYLWRNISKFINQLLGSLRNLWMEIEEFNYMKNTSIMMTFYFMWRPSSTNFQMKLGLHLKCQSHNSNIFFRWLNLSLFEACYHHYQHWHKLVMSWLIWILLFSLTQLRVQHPLINLGPYGCGYRLNGIQVEIPAQKKRKMK